MKVPMFEKPSRWVLLVPVLLSGCDSATDPEGASNEHHIQRWSAEVQDILVGSYTVQVSDTNSYGTISCTARVDHLNFHTEFGTRAGEDEFYYTGVYISISGSTVCEDPGLGRRDWSIVYFGNPHVAGGRIMYPDNIDVGALTPTDTRVFFDEIDGVEPSEYVRFGFVDDSEPIGAPVTLAFGWTDWGRRLTDAGWEPYVVGAVFSHHEIHYDHYYECTGEEASAEC